MSARTSIWERPSAGSQCYSVNLVRNVGGLRELVLTVVQMMMSQGKAPIGGQSMTKQPSSSFSCLSFMKDGNKNINIYSSLKGLFETLYFLGTLKRQVALVSSLRKAFLLTMVLIGQQCLDSPGI